MNGYCFYTAGFSPALPCAVEGLKNAGCRFADDPRQVTHLLLPVPSLDKDGNIRGGGAVSDVLEALPSDICVIGGNLPPETKYKKIDLLQDPVYVAENAYITAHCALRLAISKLPVTIRGIPVLVIGWGRIGKCLAALLKGMEAKVTVAARKESDRAILQALGYSAVAVENLTSYGYKVIFNTVPAPVLNDTQPNCLKIDLASAKGIAGNDVIHALGLPALDAPEASGALIARRVLFHIGGGNK